MYLSELDTLIDRVDAALAGRIPSSVPRMPSEGWYVVALMAYRDRQRRLRAFVVERMEAMAEASAAVPDLPEWEYEWQGNTIRMFGPSGELDDIGIERDTTAEIDHVLFSVRLTKVQPRALNIAERRLLRWRPSSELRADLPYWLREAGVLEAVAHNSYRLPPPLEERSRAVASDLALPDAEHRWRQALDDRDDDEQREMYADELAAWIRASPRGGHVLGLALQALGPVRGYELLREKIATIDYAATIAIDLLRQHRELPDCPDVAAMLRRFNAKTDLPEPARAAIEYLLERDLEPALGRKVFDDLVAAERTDYPWMEKLLTLLREKLHRPSRR